MDIGFEREIKTISGAVRNLAVSENKVDFYSTMMYADKESDTYEETSGKFVKKYLKVSKYCGDSNGDCFGDKYYNYNDTTHKKEIYEPVYKGACASLKNGASICITPQSSAGSISGLIDINGKKGPNVFGRDLRSFTIDTQFEKTSLGGGTSEVLSTPESDLEPKKPEEPEVPTPTPTPEPDDPCAESSISKACCDTKNVKKGDACCIHYQSQVGHPCYEAPEPVGGNEYCSEMPTDKKDPCCSNTNWSKNDVCRYKCHAEVSGGYGKLTVTSITGDGAQYCIPAYAKSGVYVPFSVGTQLDLTSESIINNAAYFAILMVKKDGSYWPSRSYVNVYVSNYQPPFTFTMDHDFLYGNYAN